ncbi:hypothetical protein [Ktedonobacter robiniae]|uniref:Bacteriophage Mu GpT domain-containing protein n=1 Tax=Ktedonobacter robiniae TaxID=2778365 RepID=A0ABQ3UV92_9CHLR|nr:hypothetical protein [Ktedonobacter robiniae]GHO56779.1 hypothetical protein KSB_52540 [Ktedonobacter robiniae]
MTQHPHQVGARFTSTAASQQPITITEAHIIERLADASVGAGHAVRVTVIQGGRSKNGFVYDQAALRQIAALLEDTHAYADHSRSEADLQTRSVRDVVGFYHDAEYIAGPAGQPGHVDATLHIFEAANWLWTLINEACTLGRPELIGLSVDLFGAWQVNEATGAKEISAIHTLNSCDVVTRPSAGGAFRRILHAESSLSSLPEGEHPMAEQHNTQTSEITSSPSITPIDAPITSTPAIATQKIDRLREELQRQRCELLLERRLSESILPEPVKSQVRGRFQQRLFEEQELEHELSAALTMMAQLTRDGLVRGHGYEKASITGMVSEAEKVQASFDAMFDLEIDTGRLGNVRGFTSIREAYARVTGDSSLQGGISGSSQLGQLPMSPFGPTGFISEADVTTASFSYLLGSSMNKRLLKDYQAWPAEWMKFVSIAPIRDFKQQSRVRMGAFGSLAIVPEDSPYQSITLGDSAATYVAQKRGNLVPISREAIINDDLHAIKQIPGKLAVAAAYTLAEFVYGFLANNPSIYDGQPLFTTGAPHNNLGAQALSTLALQQGVTAMREQTNFAGKRIGLRPRYLIVPPELEWTSMVVTKSAGVPGSPNNDINPMLGYVQPIVSPQLTSSTQWFLAADPREIDTIEVGFVGGQVNPALFIQDQPMLGLNFTQDVLTFKCRHEYGGATTDFRGLYRGV